VLCYGYLVYGRVVMERKGSRFGSEDACGAQVNGSNVPVTDALPVRSIVETIPCPALCLSTTGHVLELNPDAEALLGLDRDDAIGKGHISEFLPRKTCKDFYEVLTGVLTGRQAKGYRNLIKRSDGTERVLIWNMNRLVSEDDNAIGVLAIGQDITDTEQRERLTRVKRNLAVQLAGTDDLSEGLRLCVKAAIEISGMDCGAIYLMRRETGVRELAYYEGLTSESARELSRYDSSSARTMSVIKGEASYIEGREIDNLLDIQPPHENLRAIAGLPVLCEGEVVGSLYIASHSLGHISEWAKTALENIAAQIGNTIVRLQSREALRHSEAWLESILESSPAAILVIDMQGSILRCNQATVDIRGLTSMEEMVGKSVFDFVSPEDVQRAREGLVRTLEIGSIDSVEYMLMDREGCRFPVVLSTSVIKDTFGNPAGVVTVIQDITERKAAEAKIRESELRFRSLIKETTDAVFCYEYDPPIPTELAREEQITALYNGVLAECNEVCAKSYGASRSEDVIGRSLTELFGTVDGSLNELFRALLDGGYRIVDGLGVEKLPDGGERCYLNNGHAVIEDGGIVRIWGTFRDVTDHRRAQNALRETTARLQSTLDSSPDAIIVAGVDSTIIECNQATVDMHGFSDKQDIIGKNMIDLVAPADREGIVKNIEVILCEGVVRNLEYSLLRKDGHQFPAELSAGVIRNESGGAIGYVGIEKDITERKQAESALRESEEKYRKLIDDSLLGVTLLQEGRCVFANRAAVRILGYSVEELTSFSLEELAGIIHPDDRSAVIEKMTSRLSGEDHPEGLEYRIKRKDGTVRWIQVTTSVKNANDDFVIQTYSIDITDRKRAEEELRVSEEKFRRMFELYPYSSVYCDLAGNIILCNRQFSITHAIKGAPKEVIGRNVAEFFAEEERGRLLDEIRRKTKENRNTGPTECTMLREDGTTFPAMADSTLVRDHDGRPVGLVAIAQDITERKESERALMEHQERLKSLASKLALAEERERRRLASYVHDELGQRLAMTKLQLKSSLQSLSAENPAPGIDGVFAGIDELIDCIHSLTFELSSPLLYEIGLTAAIESWLDSEIQKKHGIKCRVRTDAELGDLDPDLAVVLFRNTRELVTNAVKHSQANNIHVELRKPDESIRVVVADDGIGLTSDRIKSAPDETGGFGLFSIREQIEYMGGTLEIDSAPHEGTRIIMTVPLVDHGNGDTAPARERGCVEGRID